MAEENQVEQTTETKEEEAPQVQETPQAQTFTQDEVNNIVERRLAKERGSMYKKLGVDDIDVAINAVKTQKEAEEKQRIQKGEFEEILKTRTQEHQKEKSELENQLVTHLLLEVVIDADTLGFQQTQTGIYRSKKWQKKIK